MSNKANKTKFPFSKNDVVLVRYRSEVYYAKILSINYKRKLAKLLFDDDTKEEIGFKKIFSVKEETSDFVCLICKRDSTTTATTTSVTKTTKTSATQLQNQIVLCDRCNIGYHQLCHQPNISCEVLLPDVPWQCKYCKEESDNPHILNNPFEPAVMLENNITHTDVLLDIKKEEAEYVLIGGEESINNTKDKFNPRTGQENVEAVSCEADNEIYTGDITNTVNCLNGNGVSQTETKSDNVDASVLQSSLPVMIATTNEFENETKAEIIKQEENSQNLQSCEPVELCQNGKKFYNNIKIELDDSEQQENTRKIMEKLCKLCYSLPSQHITVKSEHETPSEITNIRSSFHRDGDDNRRNSAFSPTSSQPYVTSTDTLSARYNLPVYTQVKHFKPNIIYKSKEYDTKTNERILQYHRSYKQQETKLLYSVTPNKSLADQAKTHQFMQVLNNTKALRKEIVPEPKAAPKLNTVSDNCYEESAFYLSPKTISSQTLKVKDKIEQKLKLKKLMIASKSLTSNSTYLHQQQKLHMDRNKTISNSIVNIQENRLDDKTNKISEQLRQHCKMAGEYYSNKYQIYKNNENKTNRTSPGADNFHASSSLETSNIASPDSIHLKHKLIREKFEQQQCFDRERLHKKASIQSWVSNEHNCPVISQIFNLKRTLKKRNESSVKDDQLSTKKSLFHEKGSPLFHDQRNSDSQLLYMDTQEPYVGKNTASLKRPPSEHLHAQPSIKRQKLCEPFAVINSENLAQNAFSTLPDKIVESNRLRTNENLTRVCRVCKKKSRLLCSGCRNAWYCSPHCQVYDWNQHVKDCGPRMQPVYKKNFLENNTLKFVVQHQI